MIADNTPILVGAGQFTERLDDAGYRGLSAVDIAAEAVRAALGDVGVATLAPHIDLVATTRTFDDSVPQLAFPFGRSNNFPRSICARVGIDPRYAIWEAAGGNTPQALVAEACERIADGEFSAALLCGAEAISTARHFMQNRIEVDWNETVDGQVENRGTGGERMVSELELGHGLTSAPLLYGVLENARRARQKLSREAYALQMGELFEPFSKTAASNPYSSMANRAYTAAELATVTESNRLIADPYTRLLVSRDQVNQGAAVIVTSVGLARTLGIATEKWVFLHGYAQASEKDMLKRADLGAAPSAIGAAQAALAAAGIGQQDIDFFDHYSCFPIAVSNVMDGLGIARDDPRPMTLTGGLCYFGGPGNNYSMHGIAETVRATRAQPGSRGYVGANGGFLSKYAAGVYSTQPQPFVRFDTSALNAGLDRVADQGFVYTAEGAGVVETYTISMGRNGEPTKATVIGRLASNGLRFIAGTADADKVTPAAMLAQDPLGRQLTLSNDGKINSFSLS